MQFFHRWARQRAKPQISVNEPNQATNAFLYFAPDEPLNEGHIEAKALEEAAIIKNCPALVAPWQRAWVADSSLTEMASFRRDWYQSAAAGTPTGALTDWDTKFSAMGQDFLNRNDAWKNIVEKEFGGVKAMYYREEIAQGGAAYYRVPSSLMALAPAVQIRPGSSGALVPA